MSQENVEIVRLAIAANRSDDIEARIEATLALFDPNCEWTRVTAAFESQTYRGHSGIRRYFTDMANTWANWRSDLEDVAEVEPNTVVAAVKTRVTGKESGVPVEAHLGVVFVLSEGKILRGQAYPSSQEAVEAARLLE